MSKPSLDADCSQCAALCCVLLPFDKSASFGFDKAGGEPCQNLNACHGCRIHDRLEEKGFSGCVAFDCHGAGQRVVQEVFDGADWREDLSLLSRLGPAFHRMRRIHELLLLLREAGKLPLDEAQRGELDRLTGALNPSDGWSETALADFALSAAEADVRQFLASLRSVVEA